jgi:hypothetical protein
MCHSDFDGCKRCIVVVMRGVTQAALARYWLEPDYPS